MGLTVRKAAAADGETLLELTRGLAAYEKLEPPDEAAGRRLLVDAFGPSPRIETALGCLDGTPIGYAIYFETYSSFLARPSMYLEDLFVMPDHRGAGAGRALFLSVASEARARGCGRMEWMVLDWNRPALGFYERLGAAPVGDLRLHRLTAAELVRLVPESSGPSGS